MQLADNVIQLAKERARFGFGALAQQVVKDADEGLIRLQADSRSGAEQYALVTGRQFLQISGKTFIKRADEHYRGMLDRAIQTMHTDLRVAIHKLSADNLSLIDDETVNNQIEVDRLVLRMRDAGDWNLRRLNVIVGQLHNNDEAKERENPFRPYLMARTVHQMLLEMVADEETRKPLFTLMSESLVSRLGDFYVPILEVFETSGLYKELLAQKPRQVRKSRDFDGNTLSPGGIDFDARVMPGLQRMLSMMGQLQLPGAVPPGNPTNPANAAAIGNQSLPAAPVIPTMPGIPHIPGLPTITGVPNIPGIPTIPGLPEITGIPGIPGMPAATPAAPNPAGPAAAGNAMSAAQAMEFQQFVNGIFKLAETMPAVAAGASQQASGQQNQSQPASAQQLSAQTSATPQELHLQVGSVSLVQRLNQYQQQAARGQSIDEHLAPEQNQLFALGEQLDPSKVTKLERVAIDIVAMLFELILNDEQIPEVVRGQIGRLQIPFLKAAMLTPDMLQQTQHPARQLVNRMGSAAVALDLSSPLGRSVAQEIDRIVNRILAEFNDDISIFTDSLFELERFLTDNLRQANADTKLGADALEDVEQKAVQEKNKKKKHAHEKIAAPEWMAGFKVDHRVIAFIVNVWMRVVEEEAATVSNPHERIYRDLLPDLIWSVQEKKSTAERMALVNLLPSLVSRLKEGLTLLHMTEQESREALDQLVAVHTQVLRTSSDNGGQELMTLQDMRAHFIDLPIGSEAVPPQLVESRQLETELAKRGVAIDLDLEREASPAFESDADWLKHMQVGTCVERWSESGYQMARLSWVSKRQTLFMFQLGKKTAPVVYSAISLIKSLREGSVRLVEHAPVFERAVESLLNGAREVEANREE